MEKYPFPEKCLSFQKIPAQCRANKLLYPGPHLALITPVSYVDQRSKELLVRWLMRVGLFLHFECLLKHISGLQPSLVRYLPLPTPMLIAQLIKIPL